MNTRILSLGAAIIASASLFGQSTQVSIGADVIIPQGDWSEEFIAGVGPTLGVEVPFGQKVAVTVQAGYDYLAVKDDFNEILEGASIIPVQAGLKYFFQTSQNGVYAHGQVGVHSFSEKFKENTAFGLDADTESKTNLSFGIGAGYQGDNFDLGLRYNVVTAGKEEDGEKAESLSYIGVRLGFLIHVGGK
jgi:opacity protein-like surface antigen